MELDVDYLPDNDGGRIVHGWAKGKALTFHFSAQGFSGVHLRVSDELYSQAIADLADTGSIHFPVK